MTSRPRASLVRVLPGWARGEVELRLLYPADRLLSRAVRAIVETIVERAPPLLAERWRDPLAAMRADARQRPPSGAPASCDP